MKLTRKGLFAAMPGLGIFSQIPHPQKPADASADVLGYYVAEEFSPCCLKMLRTIQAASMSGDAAATAWLKSRPNRSIQTFFTRPRATPLTLTSLNST